MLPTVRGRAGPAKPLGALDQAGANRIEFDVPDRGPEMPLVQRRGKEAVLPEMTAPLLFLIDALRMKQVNRLQRTVQRVSRAGYRHQVDMIVHQTKSKDLEHMPAAVMTQVIQVCLPVIVAEKHGLAPIAALGNVVRHAGTDDAGDSGHR